MSYTTHAFPDYESLSPELTDDDPEYVTQTARALKDVFGEYQQQHRPERDAPSYAKSRAVGAARTLYNETENQTISELLSVLGKREGHDFGSGGVSDLRVEPHVLAVVAYAESVWTFEWAVKELGGEWGEQEVILVHDYLRDLSDYESE